METSSVAKSPLDRVAIGVDIVSRWAIWLAGALILFAVFYIFADVILRKFVGYSLHSDEISGYLFAISISWALSHASLERANVRIDLLYQILPRWLAAVLDWIALVSLMVFIAFLAYYAFTVTQVSWRKNSVANTMLATPMWIPQLLWTLGFVWLLLALALLLLRISLALLRGDVDKVRRLSGIRSAQEEAQEEAAAGERFAGGSAS